MANKRTSGKAQTPKNPERSNASKNRDRQMAKKEMSAVVAAAQRYVDDVDSHASKGLKSAVMDVQTRQKKLQIRIAEIADNSMESMDAGVAATQKALGEFDAFVARVGTAIDEEWAVLSKRSTVLRAQLTKLKAEALKRSDTGYVRAEKAVEDFDKFVERNAVSLEKEVLAFIDRAEPQLRSLREAIAVYSVKSAEMARAGGAGVAELWSDLTVRQKNAQNQFSRFSKSTARAWKGVGEGLERAWTDMEKSGRLAASRYGDKAKPKTAPKTGTAKPKVAVKKAASKTKPATKRPPKSTKP